MFHTITGLHAGQRIVHTDKNSLHRETQHTLQDPKLSLIQVILSKILSYV